MADILRLFTPSEKAAIHVGNALVRWMCAWALRCSARAEACLGRTGFT